tara:strand:+ start:285 stop:842 length:558 start_codon:yes stop_codon:yes gene_type:complete
MKKSLLLQTQSQTRVIAAPVVNPVVNTIKAALLTALVALVWALSSSYVWANSDQIVGSWVTPDDKAVVEIYQQGDQYFGKFVSLKEPTYAADNADGLSGQIKVDRNNPDTMQHEQPIIGLVMLNGMTYAGEKKGKHKWQGGTIYDPGNGKAYKCTIKLNADGTLDLRGYIGISLFGRTQTWRPKP